MRLAFVIPVAVFAALGVVFGVYLYQVGVGGKDISSLPSVLIDTPVPEFTLPPIEGRNDGFSSEELKGKVSLVNLFASWCPPCKVEHPILMRMARDGVIIYGINYKDPPEDARRFIDTLGNPYRKIGADTKGTVAVEWGITGYPETFVIDRDGRIRYRHVGPITPEDLEKTFNPMIRKLSQ